MSESSSDRKVLTLTADQTRGLERLVSVNRSGWRAKANRYFSSEVPPKITEQLEKHDALLVALARVKQDA